MWEGGGVHFGIMSGLQLVRARVLEDTGGGGSVLGVSCEYVPGGCWGGGGGRLSGMPRLVDDGGGGWLGRAVWQGAYATAGSSVR